MVENRIAHDISLRINGEDDDAALNDLYFESGTTNTVAIDISKMNRSTIAGTTDIYFNPSAYFKSLHIYHVWFS